MNTSAYALTFLAAIAIAGASEVPPNSIEVVRLADGVYAALQKKPPGLWANSNSVFVINDHDVIVIDTNVTLDSARETLAALRKLTDKPVRYVVNTHWHEDHIVGNQVYRDAFPDVEIVSTRFTREAFDADVPAGRKAYAENGPAITAQLKEAVATNRSLDGTDLSAEEQISYVADIEEFSHYHAQIGQIKTTLPTATTERLILHRGSRTIDIQFLGGGHTAGDLIVHLPQEKIVIAGDIVVWPVPYAGPKSLIAEWSKTLREIIDLKPSIIVPGHGVVLRDDTYLRLVANMFASITQQAKTAVERGETLEQARKSIKIDEFRKSIAGDSKRNQYLFSRYIESRAVTAAYNQAKQE